MDCVTDCGDAAILYCAEMHWRGAHLTYASVLSVLGGTTESHSSMRRYQLSSTSSEIAVEIPRLVVSGRWKADAAPMERTVFESAAGQVHWNCLQPRSLVELRVGERELTGLGYAECLTLTVPPWQLPMRQLRWGRFVSPSDSLAWIHWQGEHSTNFAVYNGRMWKLLSASDSEVAIRDATLRMEESFSLRAGRLGSTILPGAPALAKLFPHWLFNIEERKWRSRGTLNAEGRVSQGWVIHEVVHWKV
jgi:hypothetical protein